MDYDAVFLASDARVAMHEGGYQANPNDPGNWTGGALGKGTLKGTNFGISAMEYPNLDIVNLTAADAQAIRFQDYWQKYGYGNLLPAIAGKVYDIAINEGPGTAAHCLQRAVRACGSTLVDDGIMGSGTVAAANHCVAACLIVGLRAEIAAHYREHAPSNDLPGLLARAYDET